ncbi:xyloglucan glycosyltransferase 4 [Arthrobacter sp. Hiyo8]|nr:xyloglucan glycosyltransferase 4 [Arthrobacter sp. Hiyo8]
MNWAAGHTDPEAELIGVVDADYQVRPDWLRKTVGHFTEPRTGFVQAPHAYRDHAGSRFRRWANWEYAVFFTTGMAALNEHNAGLTVGTMSLIRRAALEEAGGWAEWCLTEDSELAIRIHALGYDSVYLNEPFGWGLIPETFTAYRKQRFRWTYGPVQEMRRHWRMFVRPGWAGGARS